MHGTEQGLGEQILATYDRLGAASANLIPPARNKGAKDPFSFVLRNLDGSALPLAPLKGKVIVLSFWATWCGPCHELEPEFAQIAKNYAGNTNLAFYAVNTDEDETLVPGFVAKEKWDVPVVFADGLGDHSRSGRENRFPHGRISNQRVHRIFDHRYPGRRRAGELGAKFRLC